MNIAPEIIMGVVAYIRTKGEKDLLRDRISELEAAIFRSDPNGGEKIITTHFPEHLAVIMRKILQDPVFKDSPEMLKKFFQELRDTIDILQLLKLSLAFNPSEEMIIRLHEWVKKNLGSGVVLDINYDGSMLGGARIIFKGRYKEVTLAQMITEVLAKEKTTVMGMIK